MQDFYNFQIIPLTGIEKIEEKLSGNNEKGLLVLTKQTENTEALLNFRNKILKAAGFAVPQDVLLLNLTDEDSFSLSSLLSKYPIESIIVFGFSPKFLGLNWNLSTFTPFLYGDRKYLFTEELGDMENDKGKKGQLWKCLQAMYL